MKTFHEFESIEQFRSLIKEVQYLATWTGIDAEGNDIYDGTVSKPTLTFTGTVKIHGTNSAIAFNPAEGYWYQSHGRIITPTDDNYGFARWASEESIIPSLFKTLLNDNNITLTGDDIVVVYGEWAGKGVLGGTGIAEFDKSFYVFGAKFLPTGSELKAQWLDFSGFRFKSANIYNMLDFPTFSVEINFNNPNAVLEQLVKLTEEVERECPVAKARGVEGIGEGIVWVSDFKGKRLMFKTKGEKHSVSKVKSVTSVEPEKLASMTEFVEYAVTPNRLKQALSEVFGESGEPDIKRLGDVIKWIQKDVMKEETDTLVASNLKWEDVAGRCAAKTRELFFAIEVA